MSGLLSITANPRPKVFAALHRPPVWLASSAVDASAGFGVTAIDPVASVAYDPYPERRDGAGIGFDVSLLTPNNLNEKGMHPNSSRVGRGVDPVRRIDHPGHCE